MMKDGLGGQIMKEIFCLKPKMYSNKYYYHEKEKKAKGPQKCHRMLN